MSSSNRNNKKNITSSSTSKKKTKPSIAHRETAHLKRELRHLKAVTKPPRAITKARPKSHPPRAITRVVGTGVEAPKWTGRTPYRRLSGDGRTCEYRSMDYIGTITIPSTAQVGDVLFSIALSPLLVSGTRLQREAGQWERYRPREWEFLLSSMHGTTFDGQVIAFVDPDPADVWTNTPLNINKAAAQFNSQPDNVWKNFETRLPIVSGVPDFYTNPVSSSDVRFTQAGVLRVVYTGGCVFPSGVTSYQLFNVYQWVDLTFIQPELDLTGSTSAPIGRATTTQSQRGNLLNGATVSSSIPVSITPDGATIDTSNLGGSNLVVELITTAENLSDVASSFGVDLGIADALDSVRQVVRLAERGGDNLAEAVSQFVLSGDQSWAVTPTAFGIPRVNMPSTVMNLFSVPSTITTISDACRLTRMRKVQAVPANTSTCASWHGIGITTTSTEPAFKQLLAGPGSVTESGFNPTVSTATTVVNGSNEPCVYVTWESSEPGDILELHMVLEYGGFAVQGDPIFSYPAVYPGSYPIFGAEVMTHVYTSSESTGPTVSQSMVMRFETTISGQCQVRLPDYNAPGTDWLSFMTMVVYPANGVGRPIEKTLKQSAATRAAVKAAALEADSNEGEVSAPRVKTTRFSPSLKEDEGFCHVNIGKVREAQKIPHRSAQ